MVRRPTLLQSEYFSASGTNFSDYARYWRSRVRARQFPGHGAPKNLRGFSPQAALSFSRILSQRVKLYRSAAHLASVIYDFLCGQHIGTKWKRLDCLHHLTTGMRIAFLWATGSLCICFASVIPSQPSILELPSNNTLFALPLNETNTNLGVWPNLPYDCHIEGDLYLNIQEYGRVVSRILRGTLIKSLLDIIVDIILETTIVLPDGQIVFGDIETRAAYRQGFVSVQFVRMPYSSSWLTSGEAQSILHAVFGLADTPEPAHEIRFAWIDRAGRQIGRFEMALAG